MHSTYELTQGPADVEYLIPLTPEAPPRQRPYLDRYHVETREREKEEYGFSIG